MDLQRYSSNREEIEYEGVQLTPDNLEEVAKHFELEYVKDYMNEDGTVEEALFRSGGSVPVVVGMFVVRPIHGVPQVSAVYAGDFSYFFTEIKEHPFVPQIIYSKDENYPVPCVFCGHERHGAPYHRDLVPGETLTLPDGSKLKIKAT